MALRRRLGTRMTSASDLELASTVVVARDVLSTQLGSEQVMLNLRDGTYYGLDEVGAAIWNLLQRPIKVAEICDAIVEGYEVEAERCRRDVVRLLRELMEHGLVELRAGP